MPSQENKNEKKLRWTAHDWIWLTIVLSFFIIFLLTNIVIENEHLQDFMSMLATIVSIILSVVAIIYSFIQTLINDKFNSSLQSKIEEALAEKARANEIMLTVRNDILEIRRLKEEVKGVKTLNKDVIDILDKVKDSKTLTTEDKKVAGLILEKSLEVREKRLEAEKEKSYDSVFDFMDS